MALLLVLTLDGTGESRQLSAGGLTVGRAEDNDWVLPGTAAGRALSRRHCRFDMGARGATVADLGSTNGTSVDGHPLPPRKPTPLRGGESIEVGAWRLSVELVEADARASELPALGMPGADPSMGVRGLSVPPTRPVRRSVAAAAARDTKTLSGAMFREVEKPDAAPESQLQGDPLAGAFNDDLQPLPRNRKTNVTAEQPNVSGPPHLEAMLRRRQPETAETAQPVAAFPDPLGSFAPAEVPKRRTPDVTPPAAKPQPRRHAESEHDPFGLGLIEKTRVPLPVKEAAPAAVTRPSPAAAERIGGRQAADSQAKDGATLRAAFLAGADVPASTTDDRAPEQFFRETGRMFAALAEGLRELLAMRAIVKDHAGLDRTQISATLNNPLKLSVSRQEAVAALVGKPEDGYLAPLAAVEASYRDLKAHELALLDGVQSAVDELLELFKPAALEGKLDGSGIANLLQGGRRARLWELYQERYDDIARSARSRFMGRLDDAFRAAYTRKTAELSASSEPPVALSSGALRS
jgi:type VI secretion system protein